MALPNPAEASLATVCAAPTVSMYFDQFGNVRACCQNTGTPMGSVTTQSIREIWEGESTERLRSALSLSDFSQGCGFCKWQTDQGDELIMYARNFDELRVAEARPRWPAQMEFAMTNTCNLQCVMCNGDWSSSIRAHREHRAPLPVVYHEEFFDELSEFLPHLQKANFLGGEPFLGREPLRVMSMLADLDDPPSVAVTTNGTQWSERTEEICERLPMSFVLSLDGITKATYESIRIGADFESVMENLRRFQSYARRHGTDVNLAHCLMRSNWREFSRFLHFAEEHELGVGMNEVIFPPELSLFQLPADELGAVVAAMERDEPASTLTRLRDVWDGQLDALRHRLHRLEGGVHTFIRPWAEREQAETWEQQAVRVLSEWSEHPPPVRLTIDASGDSELTGTTTDFLGRFGLEQAERPQQVVALLATHFEDPAVTRRYSDMLDDLIITDAEQTDQVEFRISWNTRDGRTTAYISVRNHPVVPADPRSAMEDWCGADRVVVVDCDAEDRITHVSGPIELLDIGPAAAIDGSSTGEVFERISERRGGLAKLEAGPSGYIADSLVTFGPGSDGESVQLRVMVDRTPLGASMVIGVGPRSTLTTELS